MLAVIVELAKRVADRSPPEKSTSTPSALAMLMSLSLIALTSSREYIWNVRSGACRAEAPSVPLRQCPGAKAGKGYYVGDEHIKRAAAM